MPPILFSERFGTCVTQKVTGNSLGVSKNSNLVIVRALSNAASFIYALSKIILDLDSRRSKEVRTKGRKLINFSVSYKPRSNFEEVVLESCSPYSVDWRISSKR